MLVHTYVHLRVHGCHLRTLMCRRGHKCNLHTYVHFCVHFYVHLCESWRIFITRAWILMHACAADMPMHQNSCARHGNHAPRHRKACRRYGNWCPRHTQSCPRYRNPCPRHSQIDKPMPEALGIWDAGIGNNDPGMANHFCNLKTGYQTGYFFVACLIACF